MASIAVLKSTCFLASLHVRVKVAYFLGGVDGMLGLMRGPRDEAVLQVTPSLPDVWVCLVRKRNGSARFSQSLCSHIRLQQGVALVSATTVLFWMLRLF